MNMFALLSISASDWQSGLEPAVRNIQPSSHSIFLLIIAVLLVLMAFNFRHLSRVLRTCADQLVSGRRGRSNVFDEHPAGDIRVMILLIVLGILSCGELFGAYIAEVLGVAHKVESIVIAVGIMSLWYLLLFAAYTVVGYTFTDSENAQEWVRSFNSSQALAGVILLFPTLVAVFYPATLNVAFWVGIVIFISLRLLFIFKGFRIFYHKIGSLLYFILYLCTLEIIPLIFVYQSSCSLVYNYL